MTVVESPFEKVRRKMAAARIEAMSQLAKFSKEELERTPNEGDWSALRIAHHLYIADGVLLEQMKRVQEEDNPEIPDVGKLTPQQTVESEQPASLDVVMTGMAARREEVFEYLANLPAEAWERPLHSVQWGERKFYQLVNVVAIHEQQHAQQLEQLKASLG